MKSLFVDSNIAQAKTLSTEFYTHLQFFEQSKEKIFAKSWHYIGDESEVREMGKIIPVSLLENFLEEPIILSRDKEKQLHCLSNVCTHRGSLLIEKPCVMNDIRCRYHGRRFQLNGAFISMPEFKEVENFPSPEDSLTQLPLFNIGNLLFTSLNKIAGYYFWVFPNMMFNFYPWGLSLNIIKPVSINKTMVTFHSFIWDESKFNQGAGSNLNAVEMEDEAVVESVQKGIRSRFYTHGRYSVKQEKGTHHFHQLIAKFMNA